MLLLVVGLCASLALRPGWFLPSEEFHPPDEPPAVHPRDKFYGLAVPSSDVVWMAGNLGKILRSEDGGESWEVQSTPVDENLQDIAAWDEKRAVAVGDSNVLLVTGDAGATWRRVEDHPRAGYFGKLIRVKTVGENAAVIAGQAGMVMSTEDGGETWRRLHPDQRGNWNDVAPVDRRHLVAVGEFGGVSVGRAADTATPPFDTAAFEWSEVRTPVRLSLKAIDFRDARHGVAVGLSGSVLRTDNGGDSWLTMSAGTEEHLWDVVWDPARDRWLAVGSAGLYSVWSPDEGDTQWAARRLSDDEYGWHTEAVPTASRSLLVGDNAGVLQDREWRLLPAWKEPDAEETNP